MFPNKEINAMKSFQKTLHSQRIFCLLTEDTPLHEVFFSPCKSECVNWTILAGILCLPASPKWGRIDIPASSYILKNLSGYATFLRHGSMIMLMISQSKGLQVHSPPWLNQSSPRHIFCITGLNSYLFWNNFHPLSMKIQLGRRRLTYQIQIVTITLWKKKIRGLKKS